MNRLWTLAAMFGALFFVFVCSMAVTGSPSVAQAIKPAQDVRVVNGAAQPVPVSVQGTPTVSVGNSVAVSSLPAVQIGNDSENAVPVAVSSLPAVQVGNDSGSPIPVTVSNLPAVQTPGEPVAIFGTVPIQDSFMSGSAVLYTVPTGKRLKITFMTCAVQYEAVDAHHRFSLTTQLNSVSNFCVMFPDGRLNGVVFDHEAGSKEILMYADADTQVTGTVLRDTTISETTRTLFATFSLIGELQDMP